MVFSSREMQGRLMQTKVDTTSFPHSVSKEVSPKPLKVAAAKKYFRSVFIIDTTCFDECFSFHVITENSILYTNLSLTRGLVQTPSCCVLSNKCFERSTYFTSIISTIILWRCRKQWFKIKLLFLKFSQKTYLLITFLLHSLIL